jgi:all-trans-nonaprenyl-diphosphate synthase
VERELTEPGDLEEAVTLVNNSQGIARSRALAEEFSDTALKRLDKLPSSPSKQALIDLTDYILKRIY